ncbi:threonine--tRNA ligase [archaeon]|jgi:threonyl-tRNA synthetase|nr:threonine--tRNA ligase [archaeon]MBT6182287.1 threonine--tRNA ligase [archaeon]MBT6606493.1 threonine--tRNA ligase [archaeon]MBT7251342.1 threonine--tRNA ligase [archaeon]MBT7661023.1 threonine--tRNA ligase [archaeon]
MKTLNLHCDYIRFTALKKALRNIEEIAPGQTMEGESKDCLVVMVAVEKGDSLGVARDLMTSITEIASQVQTKNIVLYPYAHLSSNLGKPSLAIEILDGTAKKLKDFEVVQAPFGYYKSFELKVKGHPLSELSREIGNEIISGNEEEITEEDRKQLLREVSRAKLDTSKLKENDHRIIGSKLDLWSFNNVAPGMVFWHPKGLHIKNKLIEFWRELHRRENYSEISTPQILDKKLWEISGHWTKYGDSNFKTQYEKRDFLVKPMNCPGGMIIYKTSPKSYKNFPLRVGEMGTVHRVELSGVLAGLFRVIQFTQDDAHIFCTEKQLEEEVGKVIDLTIEIFETFGLKFDHVELSTRPEKRIGEDSFWNFAEKALENILKKRKMKFVLNKGDGAFYGPKIDFHVMDSLKRTWQCSTIQLDMALPERFDLVYQAEDGKEKRPIMLHRAIYGSLERFLGIVTEHLDGKYPLWLSPNQIKVMTLNDDVKDYAQEVYQKLFDAGFEVELNDKSESMGKKAREAQVQRFNYLVTVGESEKKDCMIAVRNRNSKEIEQMNIGDFVTQLKKEINERTL